MNLRSSVQLVFDTKNQGDLVLNSPNDDILAVTTRKDLGARMGNFSIILGPRVAKQLITEKGTVLISDIIQPFDLVQIKFKTNGDYKTEMIGVVSRAAVVLKIAPGTGKPTRVIKIDGFDFGKVLESFKLYFNPFYVPTSASSPTQNLQALGGAYFFAQSNLFYNSTPAQFIQKFLAYCFTTQASITGGPIYPLKLGSANKPIDNYIDFNTGISSPFTTHVMTDPTILTTLQSGQDISIYDIVKAYADIPFHETFLDLRRPLNPLDATSVITAERTHVINPTLPSSSLAPLGTTPNPPGQYQQPYVFNMRVTPFSSSDYSNLAQHSFLTTDVMEQDIAISEDNIYNYYEVLCERESFIMGTAQIGSLMAETFRRVPIFDQSSISTFGFRRFPQNSTKYVEFINDTDSQNLTIIQKQAFLARLLLNWFSYGEYFESGTISLKGRVGVGEDGITMGSRLVEKSPSGTKTGKEFYIEAVIQDWAFGDTLKTSAAITRGHFPFNKFLKDGTPMNGRFYQVAALEKQLNLTGPGNDQYFENITV